MNPKVSSLFSRFSSIFTLVCFTFSTVAWSAPDIQITPILTPKAGFSDGIVISDWAQDLNLPEAYGQVRDQYRAQETTASDSRNQNPVILHLQDAHAHAEAQENIKNILEHLSSRHHIEAVFVEGATEALDANRLRYFRDDHLNQRLAALLAREGLLGGAELMLLDNASGSMKALGVEDPALYRKNLYAYRAVLAEKSYTDAALEKIKVELMTRSSREFGKNLKDFFREWLFYEDVPGELMRHLKVLQDAANRWLDLDLKNARSQIEWPQLVRFVQLQELQGSVNGEEAKKDCERLIGRLVSQKEASRYIKAFQSWKEGEALRDREEEDPRAFLEAFYDTFSRRGFSFSDYPALRDTLGMAILRVEMEAEPLMAEMKQLTSDVLDRLAETDAEKKLIRDYQDYLLLKKLFSLELVTEEYEEVLSRAQRLAEILPERTSQKEANPDEAVTSRMYDAGPPSMKRLMDQALLFYRLAQRREKAIFDSMQLQMKQLGLQRAALITGGFHAEGLHTLFRDAGISYVEITPHISQLPENHSYEDLMTMRGTLTRRSHANAPRLADSGLASNLPEYANAYMLYHVLPGLGTVIAEAADLGAPLASLLLSVNESPAAQLTALSASPEGILSQNASAVTDAYGEPLVFTATGLKSGTAKEMPVRAELRSETEEGLDEVFKQLASADTEKPARAPSEIRRPRVWATLVNLGDAVRNALNPPQKRSTTRDLAVPEELEHIIALSGVKAVFAPQAAPTSHVPVLVGPLVAGQSTATTKAPVMISYAEAEGESSPQLATEYANYNELKTAVENTGIQYALLRLNLAVAPERVNGQGGNGDFYMLKTDNQIITAIEEGVTTTGMPGSISKSPSERTVIKWITDLSANTTQPAYHPVTIISDHAIDSLALNADGNLVVESAGATTIYDSKGQVQSAAGNVNLLTPQQSILTDIGLIDSGSAPHTARAAGDSVVVPVSGNVFDFGGFSYVTALTQQDLQSRGSLVLTLEATGEVGNVFLEFQSSPTPGSGIGVRVKIPVTEDIVSGKQVIVIPVSALSALPDLKHVQIVSEAAGQPLNGAVTIGLRGIPLEIFAASPDVESRDVTDFRPTGQLVSLGTQQDSHTTYINGSVVVHVNPTSSAENGSSLAGFAGGGLTSLRPVIRDDHVVLGISSTAGPIVDLEFNDFSSGTQTRLKVQLQGVTPEVRYYVFSRAVFERVGIQPENISNVIAISSLNNAGTHEGDLGIQFVPREIVLPEGFTRAASNPNYAFSEKYERVGSNSRFTLQLMDLRTGAIQDLTTASAPLSSLGQVRDVSPDDYPGGPVVIYQLRGASVSHGAVYQTTARRVKDASQSVEIPRTLTGGPELEAIHFEGGQVARLRLKNYVGGSTIYENHTVKVETDRLLTSSIVPLFLVQQGQEFHINEETGLGVQPLSRFGRPDNFVVFIYDLSAGTQAMQLLQNVTITLDSGGHYTFADIYATPSGRQVVSAALDADHSNQTALIDARTGEVFKIQGAATSVSYNGRYATYSVVSQEGQTSQVTVDLETFELLITEASVNLLTPQQSILTDIGLIDSGNGPSTVRAAGDSVRVPLSGPLQYFGGFFYNQELSRGELDVKGALVLTLEPTGETGNVNIELQSYAPRIEDRIRVTIPVTLNASGKTVVSISASQMAALPNLKFVQIVSQPRDGQPLNGAVTIGLRGIPLEIFAASPDVESRDVTDFRPTGQLVSLGTQQDSHTTYSNGSVVVHVNPTPDATNGSSLAGFAGGGLTSLRPVIQGDRVVIGVSSTAGPVVNLEFNNLSSGTWKSVKIQLQGVGPVIQYYTFPRAAFEHADLQPENVSNVIAITSLNNAGTHEGDLGIQFVPREVALPSNAVATASNANFYYNVTNVGRNYTVYRANDTVVTTLEKNTLLQGSGFLAAGVPDVSADGRYLVLGQVRRVLHTGHDEKSLELARYDIQSGQRLPNIVIRQVENRELLTPADVRFAPGSNILARLTYADGGAELYDVASGQQFLTQEGLERLIREDLLAGKNVTSVTAVSTGRPDLIAAIAREDISGPVHVYVYSTAGEQKLAVTPNLYTAELTIDDTGKIAVVSGAGSYNQVAIYPLDGTSVAAIERSVIGNQASVRVRDEAGENLTVEFYSPVNRAGGIQVTVRADEQGQIQLVSENEHFIPAEVLEAADRPASNPAFRVVTRLNAGSATTENYDLYTAEGVYVTSFTKNYYGGPSSGSSAALPDVSPDGKYAVMAYQSRSLHTGHDVKNTTLVVYNIETAASLPSVRVEEVDNLELKEVVEARFVPGSNTLAQVVFKTGETEIYNVVTGNRILPLPAGYLRALSNPDFAFRLERAGETIQRPGSDVQRVFLLNLVTGEESAFSVIDHPEHFDVSPDGHYGMVSSYIPEGAQTGFVRTQSNIQVRDLTAGTNRTIELPQEKPVADARFIPGSSILIRVVYASGEAEIYDASTGQKATVRSATIASHLVNYFPSEGKPFQVDSRNPQQLKITELPDILAVNTNGAATIFVKLVNTPHGELQVYQNSVRSNDSLVIFNAATGYVQQDSTQSVTPGTLTVSASGDQIAVAGRPNRVYLIAYKEFSQAGKTEVINFPLNETTHRLQRASRITFESEISILIETEATVTTPDGTVTGERPGDTFRLHLDTTPVTIEKLNPLDTNLDGHVSPSDALRIINYLNSGRTDYVRALDTNRDGHITAGDVLRIINYLNDRAATAPEGESPVSIVQAEGEGGVVTVQYESGKEERFDGTTLLLITENREKEETSKPGVPSTVPAVAGSRISPSLFYLSPGLTDLTRISQYQNLQDRVFVGHGLFTNLDQMRGIPVPQSQGVTPYYAPYYGGGENQPNLILEGRSDDLEFRLEYFYGPTKNGAIHRFIIRIKDKKGHEKNLQIEIPAGRGEGTYQKLEAKGNKILGDGEELFDLTGLLDQADQEMAVDQVIQENLDREESGPAEESAFLAMIASLAGVYVDRDVLAPERKKTLNEPFSGHSELRSQAASEDRDILLQHFKGYAHSLDAVVEISHAAADTIGDAHRVNDEVLRALLDVIVPVVARTAELDVSTFRNEIETRVAAMEDLVQSGTLQLEGAGSVVLSTAGRMEDRKVLLLAAIPFLVTLAGRDTSGNYTQSMKLVGENAKALKDAVYGLKSGLSETERNQVSRVLDFAIEPGVSLTDTVRGVIHDEEKRNRAVAVSLQSPEAAKLSSVLENILKTIENAEEMAVSARPEDLAKTAEAYVARALLLADLASRLRLSAELLKKQPDQIAVLIREYFAQKLPDVIVNVGEDGSFELSLASVARQLTIFKDARRKLSASA